MNRNIILGAVVWVFFLPATGVAEVLVKKFPDGRVRSEIEVNAFGFPHGLSREYYPNGKLKAERRYRDGRLEGVSRLFHEDGGIMTEWHYREGKRDGPARGYYPNGKLKDKGFYKNDKLEGDVFKYYSTGRLKMEMRFKNDRPDGTARVYGADGILRTEYTYRRGALVRQKSFDAAGGVTLDRTFDRRAAPPP